MNDEQIIRHEASEFMEYFIHLDAQQTASSQFDKIKEKLEDFYSQESKALFLDQVELFAKSELQQHRDERHNGEASPSCDYEIRTEKFLFYLKQELGTLPAVAHKKTTTTSNKARSKVFVSYSHADKEYMLEIQRHFKPFLDKIEFWDDTKINPGDKWKDEIKKAIEETKVAILLVSTDFMCSDFISSHELPPLLEAAEINGATILTVILKPCLFESLEELNQFQAMNPPDRPLIKMDEIEREELFVNIVRQTMKLLNE